MIVGTWLFATTALAQLHGGPPEQPGDAGGKPTCPASGFAPPLYGTVGVNGGGGQFAYELASPCIPQIVRDASEAVGMGREFPLGVKNVTTIIWSAKGSMANANGGMDKLDKLDVQMNYFSPAVRLAWTVGGKTTTQVYAEGKAWTEQGEGGAASPLAASQGELLASLIRMTPFGGIWAAVEAEGTVKVTKVGGKTVLTGTSPYDDKVEVTTVLGLPGKAVGLEPKLTVDVKDLPETVSFSSGGHSYVATFSDYRLSWEPDYRVIFPAKIKWTRDGKPLADLDVSYFHSNPYVLFPVPANSTLVATPTKKRTPFQEGFVAQKAALGGTTPKTADGHPDFTGAWNGGFPTPYGPYELRHPGTLEPDQATVQRGIHLNKPHYKPEFWSKVRGLDYSKVDVDPSWACAPTGVPRQMAPGKIMQNTSEILFHNGDSNRFIPLDGRKLTDEDFDQSTFDGIGSAHWEGDTLVVESVGFNDVSWLMWQGYFHSNQMKVTERLWRKGDLLFYNATVNDPEVLVEPWTTDTVVRRLAPAGRVGETGICEELDLDQMYDPYNRG